MSELIRVEDGLGFAVSLHGKQVEVLKLKKLVIVNRHCDIELLSVEDFRNVMAWRREAYAWLRDESPPAAAATYKRAIQLRVAGNVYRMLGCFPKDVWQDEPVSELRVPPMRAELSIDMMEITRG